MAGSGGNILADRAGVRRSGSPAGRTSDGRNAAEAGESWPEVYTQSREGGGEVKRKDGGLRKKGKDKEEETSLEIGDVISKSGCPRGWLRLLRGEAVNFLRVFGYIVTLYIGTNEIR